MEKDDRTRLLGDSFNDFDGLHGRGVCCDWGIR